MIHVCDLCGLHVDTPYNIYFIYVESNRYYMKHNQYLISIALYKIAGTPFSHSQGVS